MAEQLSETQAVLNLLREERSAGLTGLRGSGTALLAARLARTSGRPLLCIAPTERQAALFEQDLGLFTELPVFLYPGYEIPPYTPLSPDSATVAGRLSALYRLYTATPPFILVASCEALLRRVLPREKLAGLAELVLVGEETDQKELAGRLAAAGYESMSLVQNLGDFSIRGGILDLFPPGFDYPLRLDFFGDTVESIRLFDPITQRSVEEIEEAVLLPASDILFPARGSEPYSKLLERFRGLIISQGWQEEESRRILEKLKAQQRFPGLEFLLPLFYDATATLFDFLPPEVLICNLEPLEAARSLDLTWERIRTNYQEATAGRLPVLPPEQLFLPEEGWKKALESHSRLDFQPFTAPESTTGRVVTVTAGNHKLLKQELELQRPQQGLLGPLADKLTDWLARGDQVLFACRSGRHAAHLAELLGQYHLPVTVVEPPLEPANLPPGEILLCGCPLTEGFDLPAEQLHVLSESELFGERRLGLKKRKKAAKAAKGPALRFEELRIGDVVVHADHGLGIYEGMVNLELHGVPNDFLQITYEGKDKLYVPVDRLGSISKYQGLSDQAPKLDRLGGKAWASTKKKVKEAVWKVAQDLLDLYARRQLAKGQAFSGPDEMYRELEESFPYDETPGQLKAINAVLDDLTSDQPMDRLICGDVGYGKTEVAVRAAFKVVGDGYQVAMLVPTTVLAEQHAETFRERLQGFPVRVESLSRFRTAREQREIIHDLAQGKVDIIIGTHRLLSKDVAIRKMGLLVIDEEHRFGVAHKEKIKKLRSRVDVLTLTATPIPRTLQLSLLGVRDLSVISTPPEHRRSVKTFVARHDDLVIKEAVVRELQRRGQVFLVHNRVQSIQEVAAKVQTLVPEARVAVAHGQMPGKQLEEIMVRFVRHEIEVLVCTTIIESGLDIPNANTIVITRADRLGLAEIYQLRGRVGRSNEQAYAYLLVPSLEGLSKDSQQRLRALMDYNDLGGGFKLAMSDLQIRGGGNILGVSQSGHIAAVGYDLYLDLLQRTVEDLKRKSVLGEEGLEAEEIEPEINLRFSSYLPASYIADPDQRYLAYRKIAALASEEEISDLRGELIDRYGPLPGEAANLLAIMALKIELKKQKITRLEQGPATLVFSFHEQTPVAPEKILLLLRASKQKLRFTPDGKLVVPADLSSLASVVETTRKILHTLS